MSLIDSPLNHPPSEKDWTLDPFSLDQSAIHPSSLGQSAIHFSSLGQSAIHTTFGSTQQDKEDHFEENKGTSQTS